MILLQVSHGWERLTAASREALARRVREGCGLVVVRPMGGDMMPLEPAEAVPLPADGSQPVEPAAESSPWRRKGDHYITRAIPVEAFPVRLPRELRLPRRSRTPPCSSNPPAGHPVLAVRDYGKGRVAAFGYRNAGLSWRMPMSARGFVVQQYWEYFYAMLVRSLLWAAAPRAGARRLRQSRLAAQGRRRQGGAHPAQGRAPEVRPAPGRYFLEQRAGADWRIEAIDAAAGRQKLESLTAAKEVVSRRRNRGGHLDPRQARHRGARRRPRPRDRPRRRPGPRHASTAAAR